MAVEADKGVDAASRKRLTAEVSGLLCGKKNGPWFSLKARDLSPAASGGFGF